MLAVTSERCASVMNNVYQGDFTLGRYGLGNIDVLVQERAFMLSAGAGVWVSYNIFIVCFVKTAFVDLALGLQLCHINLFRQ